MRFYNYINEGRLDEVIEILERDCKPFITDMKKHLTNFLYTGRKGINKSFVKKQVRKDRRPSDTPYELHKFIDDWFQKNFNVRIRSNSVFATSSERTARTYGDPFAIFPIGSYKSIWSPNCKDLYTMLMQIYYSEMPNSLERLKNYDDFLEREKEEFKQHILDWLNKESKYQIGLKGLDKKDIEVMIHCKEYYIVDLYNYGFDFIQHFWGKN